MLNLSRKRLAAAVSGGGAGDAFGSGGATSRSGGVARGVSDSDDPESDGACAGTACNTTISDMPHDKILQCAECRRRWHHACYARENGDVDCTELVDWNCKDCIKLDARDMRTSSLFLELQKSVSDALEWRHARDAKARKVSAEIAARCPLVFADEAYTGSRDAAPTAVAAEKEANATSAKVHPRLLFFNGEYHRIDASDAAPTAAAAEKKANATSAKVHARLLFFNGEYHRIDAMHSGGAASGSGGAPGGASGSQGAAAGSGVAAPI